MLYKELVTMMFWMFDEDLDNYYQDFFMNIVIKSEKNKHLRQVFKKI